MGDPPELSLLDGFALSVGGQLQLGIPIGSQRLLGFLAVHPGASTRARVAGCCGRNRPTRGRRPPCGPPFTGWTTESALRSR